MNGMDHGSCTYRWEEFETLKREKGQDYWVANKMPFRVHTDGASFMV